MPNDDWTAISAKRLESAYVGAQVRLTFRSQGERTAFRYAGKQKYDPVGALVNPTNGRQHIWVIKTA